MLRTSKWQIFFVRITSVNYYNYCVLDNNSNCMHKILAYILTREAILSSRTHMSVPGADPGGGGGAQGARAPPPLKNVYKIEIL